MIEKVLIANRGEIARRVIDTCREMGIATVAVFSDPDVDAPFVAEADEAYALGGATAAESYLRIEAILEAARATGADAIHPGYGFLSENAEFARACADTGLTFIGPAPETIEIMGSKLESKRRMIEAGVPTLPSIEIDPSDHGAVQAAGAEIGFPVLVKASAGGGGKGMRIVRDPADLVDAAEGAAREAAASFGDATVFLEKYLDAPRHVEIQIFGDAHGNVISLFERECSIQRRHQKIIEESPSPALDTDLRAAMSEAAIAAGRAVDYLGAGTVEFLLDADRGFYFLETNTRLQVEHPVTEMVTGLDLVRLQVMVAEGEPLPADATEAMLNGHAIEARLYAEDPTNGFLPVTGTVHSFHVSDAVRVDSAVESGSDVSVHYDPMIAKVIAWAPTRREAARVLSSALAGAEIHGLVTNRELLVRILREDEFLAGDTDTHYLERHDPAEMGRSLVTDEALHHHAIAAALHAQASRRRYAPHLGGIPSGWRNAPSQPQRVTFRAGEVELEVGYRFGRNGLTVEVDGSRLGAVELVEVGPEGVTLRIDRVQAHYSVARAGDTWYVDGPDGASTLVELPRFPGQEVEEQKGSLLAPMPGKVVRVAVAEGAEVAKGDTLVVVEAMKMEHSVRSPSDGVVTEVRIAEGDQVDGDQVMIVVDDGSEA
ncbi:MAG: ATP-grasp domain-containing protein [Acidimicrobiia bacterium]|nr:MAG: ATP-grasp domain-containing protein [Acidimicrobiia bacterium]